MRMVDIIMKKRDGGSLTKEEINFFINGYCKNEIPDYQVSALLMAIKFVGMSRTEIFDLTEAMLHSGEIVDLSSINGVKVDKHSTGGVGDKTSLVIGPLVASCGAKLAKMSGRGLGHTGGTLDKLESIPNFKIALSDEEFFSTVNEVGMAIISQNNNLVLADKKMYALRDVTATVDSIPLIASSIMSKKLASGSDAILLDVKYGEGAFMKTKKDAYDLAKLLVEIGTRFNKDTRAEITNMNEPLGMAVGNSLEVIEAINTLKGHGPKDLTEICLHSASTMLLQAKLFKTREEALQKLQENITNGKAFEVFCKFVEKQHGDVSYIKDISLFPKAKHTYEVRATISGTVKQVKALEIGTISMILGAGRKEKDDAIDMASGIVLNKKVGDKVVSGELLCTLYTEHDDYMEIVDRLRDAFVIDPTNKKVKLQLIAAEISKDDLN